MKIDSAGYSASLNPLTDSIYSLSGDKQGQFAFQLDSALSQIAQAGPESINAPGAINKGFGYVVPVMAKTDQTGVDTFGGELGLMAGNASGLDSEFSSLSGLSSQSDTMLAMMRMAGALRDNIPVYGSVMLSMEATAKAKVNRAIMDSFHVETNPKYRVNQKGTGDTYCSSYVADVSKALGAPVPRRVYVETGEPVMDDGSQGRVAYLNANRMNDWLNESGKRFGWVEVDAERAQYFANQGYCTVASWKNGGGAGHIQMVSPSMDNRYDEKLGVTIAQAGSKLINYGHIEDVYKTSTLKEVQYFVNVNS